MVPHLLFLGFIPEKDTSRITQNNTDKVGSGKDLWNSKKWIFTC